ncbi:MAG: hypothetical protein USCGTAYLOR_01274 [Chromatiales bacterium USCg_Taylor]|nr:MAG: hypothetical protein USCGTAYLOR_01274 [Chromatiales bacterium USCg_Taylor]
MEGFLFAYWFVLFTLIATAYFPLSLSQTRFFCYQP